MGQAMKPTNDAMQWVAKQVRICSYGWLGGYVTETVWDAIYDRRTKKWMQTKKWKKVWKAKWNWGPKACAAKWAGQWVPIF